MIDPCYSDDVVRVLLAYSNREDRCTVCGEWLGAGLHTACQESLSTVAVGRVKPKSKKEYGGFTDEVEKELDNRH